MSAAISAKQEAWRREFYPLDLGGLVRARWTVSDDLLINHEAPNGADCGVFVRLSGFDPPYRMTRAEPLTIEGRIRCPVCHLVATIEDGVWKPWLPG